MRIKDITGQRFGSLVALSCVGIAKGGALWMCRCDCSAFELATRPRLRLGLHPSCDNCAAWRWFDSKVKRADCWAWTGSPNKNGYGRTSYKGKSRLAHHISWFMHYGEWPSYLMHSCDNRACVNPAHLSEGSALLNTRDMLAKGRGRVLRGHDVSTSRLTEQHVLDIRSHSDGVNVLAARYDVSRQCIWRIQTRKSWGWLQ